MGHALVRSYGVNIAVGARQITQFLKRRLFAKKNKIIPPHSETIIPLLVVPLPDDRNFLFHLTAQTNLMMFVHIIYHDTKKVLVKNNSD